ncbi:MAG: hypothetical protein KA419_18455 [Acidobacteria bacterium]|nr:hypothetical protein [Acidobacteriota bacterium]
MEREVHIAESWEEAEAWEIDQEIRLTPEERQAIVDELRLRVYGTDAPDVRECAHAFEIRSLF